MNCKSNNSCNSNQVQTLKLHSFQLRKRGQRIHPAGRPTGRRSARIDPDPPKKRPNSNGEKSKASVRREERDLGLDEGLALQELLDLPVEAAARVPHLVLLARGPPRLRPPAAGATTPGTGRLAPDLSGEATARGGVDEEEAEQREARRGGG
jgi:hypothetical protein